MKTQDDEFEFLEALDEFTFYDCMTSHPPDLTSPATDLRRRVKDPDSLSSLIDTKLISRERGKQANEKSTVTTATHDPVAAPPPPPSNWLAFVAGLATKVVGFQFNSVVSSITFPLKVIYFGFMFFVNPLGAIKQMVGFVIGKMIDPWSFGFRTVIPYAYRWLREQTTLLNFVFRFGSGLCWALYVCVMLCALLVSSLLCSGLTMRRLVEEPIVIKQNLNFDFTNKSPTACLPLPSCNDANCKRSIGLGETLDAPVIPHNHKFQITVFLTLPESNYNRDLGMFQVRVDFLSTDGRMLSSARHPSMLKFKSQPINLLHTVLNLAPLLAGYASETQALKLEFKGFTQGDPPIECVKVMIEQRAEFQPGGGIPELYDAHMVLESQLPFFRRIIWYWKRTLFVWLSIMFFIVGFLLTLLLCGPLIMLRGRSGNHPSTPDSPPGKS